MLVVIICLIQIHSILIRSFVIPVQMQLYETTRGPKFGNLIIANSINNAKGFYQKAHILFLRAGGKLLTGSSDISKTCRYYNITHNRLTYTNWLVWIPHRFSPLVFLASFFLRS